MSLDLVGNGLEAVSLSLGSLLSETLGFGLLGLDGGNALLLGDTSVLPLLPGGKTGLLTLGGESHLALESLLETSLDRSGTTTFLTSGTDGFLVGKVLFVLDSLTLLDLGQLLLTLKLSGSELGSSISSGHLGRGSLILSSSNGGSGLSTAPRLLSITLLVFHGSLSLGGGKLSLHSALVISLTGLLLETLKLGLHLLRFLLGCEGSLLLLVRSRILGGGFLLGSLVTGLSFRLGTSTLLRSLLLEFLLLLSNDRLRLLLHLLKLGLGILSCLLCCFVVSSGGLGRRLQGLDGKHALEEFELRLDLSDGFAVGRVAEALLGNLGEWIATNEVVGLALEGLGDVLLVEEWQLEHRGEGCRLHTIDLKLANEGRALAVAVFTLQATAVDLLLDRGLTEAHLSETRDRIGKIKVVAASRGVRILVQLALMRMTQEVSSTGSRVTLAVTPAERVDFTVVNSAIAGAVATLPGTEVHVVRLVVADAVIDGLFVKHESFGVDRLTFRLLFSRLLS